MAGGTGSNLKGRRVLALLPSWGLGGGIEAYFTAFSEALSGLGAELDTVALRTPRAPTASLSTKARFAVASVLAARRLAGENDALLLVLHPGLLPVGVLTRWTARLAPTRCALFFYGADIWGHGAITRRSRHRPGWRVVTISSFCAGALVDSGPVAVLRPGISSERYERLVDKFTPGDESGRDLDVLTVFRLEQADVKGASALLAAGDIVRARRSDFSLIIAGSGRPSAALRAAISERSTWVELWENVPFSDLAVLYRRAKIFVLATRSHQPGQPGFRGEGFGIVLVEAQLAGTPVIAPFLGGSSDAFVEGLTGLRPMDESPESLATVIERLLANGDLRACMGRDAMRWSRHTFSPASYQAHVTALSSCL